MWNKTSRSTDVEGQEQGINSLGDAAFVSGQTKTSPGVASPAPRKVAQSIKNGGKAFRAETGRSAGQGEFKRKTPPFLPLKPHPALFV